MENLDPTVIALISTLFGGAGLKFIEYWLSRNKVKVDHATQIRTELRDDLESRRAEVGRLSEELDEWRERYFDIKAEYIQVKSELDAALRQIKKGTDQARTIVDRTEREEK